MPASIYDYTYELKVNGGRKHACIIQVKNEIKMKNYITLNSSIEILLEGVVRNYFTLQRVQAINLIILFQILNAVFIS